MTTTTTFISVDDDRHLCYPSVVPLPAAPIKKKNDLIIHDGLYYSVPDDVYFSLDLYNSSHGINPDCGMFNSTAFVIKRAMAFGKVFHSVVLEGDLAMLDSVSATEQQSMLEMLKAYKAHPEASRLIDNARSEVVAISNNFHGARVRGKIDSLSLDSHTIIDLKTCANFDNFKISAYTFQLAFYRSLLQHLIPSPKGYYSTRVIVCEKKAPYRCVVLKPSFADLVVKEEIIAKLLSAAAATTPTCF